MANESGRRREVLRRGVDLGVIPATWPLDRYRLVIAPIEYLGSEVGAAQLTRFGEQGGRLVLTYWTGVVDAVDRRYLGGAPGPLRDVAGLWVEELDSHYDGEAQRDPVGPDQRLGAAGDGRRHMFCEVVQATTATVWARYAGEYDAGQPAVTCNRVGPGRAFYTAAHTDDRFLQAFYERWASELGLVSRVEAGLRDRVNLVERAGIRSRVAVSVEPHRGTAVGAVVGWRLPRGVSGGAGRDRPRFGFVWGSGARAVIVRLRHGEPRVAGVRGVVADLLRKATRYGTELLDGVAGPRDLVVRSP